MYKLSQSKPNEFSSAFNYLAFLWGRDRLKNSLSFSFMVKSPSCLYWQNITWSISSKFIGVEAKSPSLVVENKRQLFCQLVAREALTLFFCCLYERSTIILVEMFSNMCCLEDNASWNCQTNSGSIRLIEISIAIAGCEKKTFYKGG